MTQPTVPDPAAGRGPDKLLAIGAYGETVAAYRYVVLAEKALSDEHRREFAAMADEEQEHKQRLQALVTEMYPGQEFVLTAEDKELVVTGPRLLEVRNEADFADAMRMVLSTERKTARFYANYGKYMPEPHIQALLKSPTPLEDLHQYAQRELSKENIELAACIAWLGEYL